MTSLACESQQVLYDSSKVDLFSFDDQTNFHCFSEDQQEELAFAENNTTTKIGKKHDKRYLLPR